MVFIFYIYIKKPFNIQFGETTNKARLQATLLRAQYRPIMPRGMTKKGKT